MIKEFVEKWDKYKNDLEDYFKTTNQEEYGEYINIVEALFEKVINQDFEYAEYDTENILVVDDGDYQGTQIFILHRRIYQPSAYEYVYTSVYYGSCTVCDTLQSIQTYGLPDEEQVKDYMTLALHLLQNCRCMEEE